MGKLKDMVAEPVSLQDRFKISARRVRLAGIGLISKMDAERSRLYRQIVELGDSYGDHDSVVGRLSLLGTGTVHLVLEESQRLFDELVDAGEQALAGEGPKGRTSTGRLATPRPVAKGPAPKLVSSVVPAKTETQPAAKKSAGSKPVLQDVSRKDTARTDPALDALKQKFEAAKIRLNTLTAPPDQITMLTLYALYKQANEGDVSGRRPAVTKMVERAKYDQRQKIKGMKSSEAMERYIAQVDSLFAR